MQSLANSRITVLTGVSATHLEVKDNNDSSESFQIFPTILFLYTMQRELYFDISAEGSGGSLYRIKDSGGNTRFLYQHSTYDDDRDEIKIFETTYNSFAQFWQMLIQDRQWFYQHPLYVHAEQRAFVSGQLQGVNWAVHPNQKWQDSHQRQWKKVLTDKDNYYRSNI